MTTQHTPGRTYRGTRRDGVAIVGKLPPGETTESYVERQFLTGWRALTVERDGERIGGIEAHPDTGTRTWWAEGRA